MRLLWWTPHSRLIRIRLLMNQLKSLKTRSLKAKISQNQSRSQKVRRSKFDHQVLKIKMAPNQARRHQQSKKCSLLRSCLHPQLRVRWKMATSDIVLMIEDLQAQRMARIKKVPSLKSLHFKQALKRLISRRWKVFRHLRKKPLP